MEFSEQEVSNITLSLETLMEQLYDDYQNDRDDSVRRKYYKIWDLKERFGLYKLNTIPNR